MIIMDKVRDSSKGKFTIYSFYQIMNFNPNIPILTSNDLNLGNKRNLGNISAKKKHILSKALIIFKYI